MRLIYAFSICLLSIKSPAQPARNYSHADSLRAKQYFDSSWNYRLGSEKHQLYLDSALMLIPTHAWYWQQKSMPYYKSYKYELGRPYIDSAIKYDPSHWLDYCAFLECIYERNYQKSLNNFHKAKASYGNRPVMDHPYNFFIGLCHLQLNQFDSARHYFLSCIDDEIKAHGEDWVHQNHLFYLGIVYYETEQYNKAIECFDKAIKLYKRFSDAKYYKSQCLYTLGEKQEALLVMEDAAVDYNAGYGFNEDNALYEYYPYQLRKYNISTALKFMRNSNK